MEAITLMYDIQTGRPVAGDWVIQMYRPGPLRVLVVQGVHEEYEGPSVVAVDLADGTATVLSAVEYRVVEPVVVGP